MAWLNKMRSTLMTTIKKRPALQKTLVVGAVLGVPVMLLLCYGAVMGVLYATPLLFWDQDEAAWQSVRVELDTGAVFTLRARPTHPTYDRYRVELQSRPGGEFENLHRQPIGEFDTIYLYRFPASTPDSERATIIRLANGVSDHWLDLDCGCLRQESSFVPLAAERPLGVVTMLAGDLAFVRAGE